MVYSVLQIGWQDFKMVFWSKISTVLQVKQELSEGMEAMVAHFLQFRMWHAKEKKGGGSWDELLMTRMADKTITGDGRREYDEQR